jgi:hypothetical protein
MKGHVSGTKRKGRHGKESINRCKSRTCEWKKEEHNVLVQVQPRKKKVKRFQKSILTREGNVIEDMR